MKKFGFILWLLFSQTALAVDCHDESLKEHPVCKKDYFPVKKNADRLRTRIKLDFSIEERDAFSFPHAKKEVIKRGSLSFEWVF